MGINKKSLTEAEIRTRYITKAIIDKDWNLENIREEFSFTAGRIIDEGNGNWHRGSLKRADYLLTYNSNYIAVIEAKDNNKNVGAGIQQAMEYAKTLDVPFAFSSNGDGFIKKNMVTGFESYLNLDEFPTPEELWQEYKLLEKIDENQEKIIIQSFYPAKYSPRYYQQIAIERTVKAIAKGKDKVLLVMATGTGKTYTAFQIIYKLWKSRTKKRILYLADRNVLIDQTMINDFAPFKSVMTKIKGEYDPAYEIYMGLYQQLKGNENKEDLYKKIPANFFDLIVIDECHRGSAAEDSAWREILDYFSSATKLGLTATPKNDESINTYEYFGEPVYTYSLKQGIEDGFLAPYRVIRVGLDKDINGIEVPEGTLNTDGEEVKSGLYNGTNINRRIVLPERDKLVAKIVTDYLKATNRRMDKSIFFCVDIDHAERLRKELINLNLDLVEKDNRYVMRITGDDEIGKNQIDNFINPRKKYPTLVTTSKLLTTGVDVKTCKLIVIDTIINSMVEFKQIIGRGTRIDEDFDKATFTIIDFTGATELFKDPEFDGNIETIKIVKSTSLNDVNESRIPIEDTDIYIPKKKALKPKVILPNEQVYELYRKENLIDQHGKLMTSTFEDFVKKQITKEYKTFNEFKNYWNNSKLKKKIIEDLENKDIYSNVLIDEFGDEYDVYDLINKVVYNIEPLTKTERIKKVYSSNLLEEYSEKAQAVINILLNKYIEIGVNVFEESKILNIPEFASCGSMVEIVNSIFSGSENYMEAMNKIKEIIYS